MSDHTNLIYNADFHNGTDSWSATSVSASGGVLTVKGSLSQDTKYLIPVATDRKYRLTFDIKFTHNSGNSFYIAFNPKDNNKNSINIAHTNRPIKVETTLASAVANGDTTVTLTSASGWPTSRTYQRVGICNKLAWGYNRCTFSQSYSSISGNTVTLKSAWTGGSWPAGTKVAEFEDGGTYYYPWYAGTAALPTDWHTVDVEFNGGNTIRYSCQFFQFTTLGYTHEYQIRNLRFECISDYQECDYIDDAEKPQIYRTGVVTARSFDNAYMPVRYVRDTIAGSTANNGNHWCEFQIINDVGENLAWGKDVKYNTSTYANSVATDGIINSSYLTIGSGTTHAMIDLGYIAKISAIKIWHYYPDGRTYYGNVTEVSLDGENWVKVYSGQKPETSSGNTILLPPKTASIYADGKVLANDFIEL